MAVQKRGVGADPQGISSQKDLCSQVVPIRGYFDEVGLVRACYPIDQPLSGPLVGELAWRAADATGDGVDHLDIS